MADRLRRLARALAFVAVTLEFACSSPRAGASGAVAHRLDVDRAFSAIANVLADVARRDDDAAVARFALSASLAGRRADDAEPCSTAAGLPSTRPSAFVDPPMPAAAVEQRTSALLALGAFVELADVAPGVDRALAIADAQRAARAFARAADAHVRGDLFLGDESRVLVAAADALHANDSANASRASATTRAAMTNIARVVSDDAQRERRAALASLRAYAMLLARADEFTTRAVSVLPPCTQPYDTAATNAPAPDPLPTPIKTGLRARREAAALRAIDRLERLDVASAFGALEDLVRTATDRARVSDLDRARTEFAMRVAALHDNE